MKFNQYALILGMGMFSCASAVHAAPSNQVPKTIHLTAQISDSLFVSKPDGSSWYDVEEIKPVDYKQQQFTKTLPIRVWSKNESFKVTLAQPLKMSNGNYEMPNAKVTLDTGAGAKALTTGTASEIKQVTKSGTEYDQVYNLNITLDAPAVVNGLSTNGSYSGDLVMLFEPVVTVP
ncbi:CS1 type fimbrial major subunit [Serratia fonticola]|uniref:CS1 type fimbrial major subunit n=1 Tax=Serratia fonticola TaxID=47917 RepID=UPI0009403F10|nr:CS1 type fimbrial major subunit [Serratia fonticola]OKP21417.1 fimbrial assembly protein [Serratia fonticola]